MEERILKPATERLTGVLIPSGWNARFDVISLSLACDGEREVGIENFSEYPELLGFLRRQVEVSGIVEKNGDFETLRISSFEVVNDINTNK